MKRMTIREIRMHPWFQAHLPRYLAFPPPDSLQQIDEDILTEVIKIGFDKDALIESLGNRVQNDGTVAYYLLLDNRFHNSNSYLGVEFQKPEDPYNPINLYEVAASGLAQRPTGYIDYQGTHMRGQVERKWALELQELENSRPIDFTLCYGGINESGNV